MTYFAYLDEFGHIGPYVSRQHPKYKESPVFGLAGFVLPAEHVRGLGTWFFKCKCDLLEWEINRSNQHPARWEKKGSALYTVKNVTRYREIRNFTNRLFKKIKSSKASSSMSGYRKASRLGTMTRTNSTERSFSRRLSGLTNSAKNASRMRISP